MSVSKKKDFKIVSRVNKTHAQLNWTIGFGFVIARRSVGCSIISVRLVEELSLMSPHPNLQGKLVRGSGAKNEEITTFLVNTKKFDQPNRCVRVLWEGSYGTGGSPTHPEQLRMAFICGCSQAFLFDSCFYPTNAKLRLELRKSLVFSLQSRNELISRSFLMTSYRFRKKMILKSFQELIKHMRNCIGP